MAQAADAFVRRWRKLQGKTIDVAGEVTLVTLDVLENDLPDGLGRHCSENNRPAQGRTSDAVAGAKAITKETSAARFSLSRGPIAASAGRAQGPPKHRCRRGFRDVAVTQWRALRRSRAAAHQRRAAQGEH